MSQQEREHYQAAERERKAESFWCLVFKIVWVTLFFHGGLSRRCSASFTHIFHLGPKCIFVKIKPIDCNWPYRSVFHTCDFYKTLVLSEIQTLLTEWKYCTVLQFPWAALCFGWKSVIMLLCLLIYQGPPPYRQPVAEMSVLWHLRNVRATCFKQWTWASLASLFFALARLLPYHSLPLAGSPGFQVDGSGKETWRNVQCACHWCATVLHSASQLFWDRLFCWL